MLYIIAGIFIGLLGFEIGLKFPWSIQLTAAVIGVLYLRSWHSREKELGSIVDIAIYAFLLIMIAVGDIYYFAITPGESTKTARLLHFLLTP